MGQSGKIIKLRISVAAKKVIEDTADVEGMKQEAVASRIILWFAAQPEIIRRGIMGQWPAGLEVEMMKMASEQSKGKPK